MPNIFEYFFRNKNYDLRITKNGRWIDQKCTPDVISTICDCILEFVGDDINKEFTTHDIWYSEYAKKYVEQLYKKPVTTDVRAKSEYDKFFQQPMKMLSASGVLKEKRCGRLNVFCISQTSLDILEFISISEKRCLDFLVRYIIKTLKDSNIWNIFENFFHFQTKSTFDELKIKYVNFIKHNSRIGSRTSSNNRNLNAGKVEIGRIFTKVLNPISFSLSKKGTERGHMSKRNITFDMLMYNRENFRDILLEKPKNMTRSDYLTSNREAFITIHFRYLSQKAKNVLRRWNKIYNGMSSEVCDGDENPAIVMHHIFPESTFPEISGYVENIIALTPNQHLIQAHPFGNTNTVDKDFQKICLIAKNDSIRNNLLSDDGTIIYNFDLYKFVLKTGFDDESFLEIAINDFNSIKSKIIHHFVNI